LFNSWELFVCFYMISR